MKKLIFGVILLCAFGCYKDNGEPLRKIGSGSSSNPVDYNYDIIPCQTSLRINSVSHSGGISNFSSVYGSFAGIYLNGYRVHGSLPASYFEYKIEFNIKPQTKRYYTVTDNPNFVTPNNCLLYIKHRNTNKIYFAQNGTKLYVDTLSSGGLDINFCSSRFLSSDGYYLTIYNGNLTTPY